MREIKLRELLEAGCHFGHQTTRWNPKMKPYIFTARDRIHIFDLVKTKEGLEKAAVLAKATSSQGGKIIFIGTKRQSQDIVREAAKKVGMPYITEHWVGGLITNWEQLKKRLNYLGDLKAGVTEGRFKDRTKKENLLIEREIIKMEKVFGGVADLKDIPAAVFVIDGRKDAAALKEARSRGVITIAIVDTNVDPINVDFIIPANDDAVKSIQLIVDYIAQAVEEGQKQLKVPAESAGEKLSPPLAVTASGGIPQFAVRSRPKAGKVDEDKADKKEEVEEKRKAESEERETKDKVDKLKESKAKSVERKEKTKSSPKRIKKETKKEAAYAKASASQGEK